jgi:hypothetical protein
MSPLISRILLTILIFPLAALLNFIALIVLERHLDGNLEVLLPCLITDAFIVVYWLLVWRRGVKWTQPRIRRTLWAAGAAAVVGAVIGGAVRASIDWGDDEIGIYTGTISMPLLWIVGSILVWRETPAERAERLSRAGMSTVVCPACGYNLTGLSESRCPECGARYTLNDLFASQPARLPAEIEQA